MNYIKCALAGLLAVVAFLLAIVMTLVVAAAIWIVRNGSVPDGLFISPHAH